jgi:hypothetical protein
LIEINVGVGEMYAHHPGVLSYERAQPEGRRMTSKRKSVILSALTAVAALTTVNLASPTGANAAGAPDQNFAEPEDYKGPFSTQVLYAMCSRKDAASREKCHLYMQGLLYGLKMQKSMREHGTPVCLPEMTPEEARVLILDFIAATTGGRPSNNRDGGDWMAFMGLAAGHLCETQ